jgi:hypothetical protein
MHFGGFSALYTEKTTKAEQDHREARAGIGG